MKFLCDQCKAKYQISDEKVAGKTVRMKCRKCGHMIEVRAAVTETSVSVAVELPKDAKDETPATLQGAKPQAPAPRATAPSNKPTAPQKPGLTASPKAAGGLATSLSAARPRASAPPPRPEGALAGAFQRTVQHPTSTNRPDEPSALDLLELSVTEEWYVAINGVPVGPVRVSELRRKAASGAVTEESLVWQEGLEEWRPVRAIPELAAIVREAAAGGRVSLATPPPSDMMRGPGVGSQPPATAQRTGGVMPRQGPMPGVAPRAAPITGATASARNNVVPFTARSGTHSGLTPQAATAEKLDDSEILEANPASASAVSAQRVSMVSDPFGAPPPTGAAMGMGMAPSTGSFGHAAPFSAGGPGGPAPSHSMGAFGAGQAHSGSISSFPSAPPPAPAPTQDSKKSPPWIAIAMVVLAAAFGVTAAIAIFLRPPPAPAPAPIVQVAPPPPPTQPVQSAAPPPVDIVAAPTTDAGTAKPGLAGAVAMHSGAGPKPTPSSTGPKAADLGSLLGGNASGPSSGPGSNTGGGGGSSLTSDQVEATVRNHAAGVKRTCWEKIGDGKAGTVNITVEAKVSGSGSVSSATATGNDPTIGKCIEGAVRSWQFPPTGGTTTVNIPFKFVRQ